MRCKVAVRYSNALFAIPIKFNAISSHLKTISCEKLNRLSTPFAVPGDVANRKVEPEQGRRPTKKPDCEKPGFELRNRFSSD